MRIYSTEMILIFHQSNCTAVFLKNKLSFAQSFLEGYSLPDLKKKKIQKIPLENSMLGWEH